MSEDPKLHTHNDFGFTMWTSDSSSLAGGRHQSHLLETLLVHWKWW